MYPHSPLIPPLGPTSAAPNPGEVSTVMVSFWGGQHRAGQPPKGIGNKVIGVISNIEVE